MDVFERINRMNDEIRITACVTLDKFTTLRVGGPADYFAEPRTEEELHEMAVFRDLSGIEGE